MSNSTFISTLDPSSKFSAEGRHLEIVLQRAGLGSLLEMGLEEDVPLFHLRDLKVCKATVQNNWPPALSVETVTLYVKNKSHQVAVLQERDFTEDLVEGVVK